MLIGKNITQGGIPPERIRSNRYALPEQVAQEMLAAIQRRKSRAIGWGNRLLRWAAVHFETQIDALLAKRARNTHNIQ